MGTKRTSNKNNNPKGTPETLTPFKPGEQRAREAGRKGGLAMHRNLRRRKDMAAVAQDIIASPLPEGSKASEAVRSFAPGLDADEITTGAAMVAGQISSAMKGNSHAFRAVLELAQEQERRDAVPFSADFGLLIGPSFLAPHRAIAAGMESDIWLAGGRGSLKSSFASLEVVNWVEQHPEEHAVVVMRYKAALRDAAFAQVVWAIEMLGLSDDYDTPATTLRITKKSTGQLILFRGCDDAGKLKSMKVPFGHVGMVWYEEADMLRGMWEVRKVNQSLARGGDRTVRLYSFNPPRNRWNWANAEMEKRRDRGEAVFTSTYLDAPAEWLGEQFIADAAQLREVDEPAYRHEYMGEPVGTGSEVFDRVEFREITDDEIAAFDNLHAGQDFGWHPDPWAFTLSEWRQAGRELLTFKELGGNKLQPPEQAARIREALMWKDSPDDRRRRFHDLPVYSDDADPTAIASQRDSGINARAAQKGGMRMASYRFLQSCKWVIDPVRCPHLAAEVRAMAYEVNKDGEVLSTIPDGNDHWVDATRYAMMPNVRRARTAYRGIGGDA